MAKKQRKDNGDSEAEKDGAVAQIKKQLSAGAVPDEIVELLSNGGDRIDVNVLLVKIVERTPPDAFIEETERLLELIRRFEKDRLAGFREMTAAVIDAKIRDPDEKEKRSNNRVRRWLKSVVAFCAAVCAVGLVTGAALQAGVVVVGLIGILAALALSLLGPLAAGESISSNDVVRVIHAVRGVIMRTRPSKQLSEHTTSNAEIPEKVEQ